VAKIGSNTSACSAALFVAQIEQFHQNLSTNMVEGGTTESTRAAATQLLPVPLVLSGFASALHSQHPPSFCTTAGAAAPKTASSRGETAATPSGMAVTASALSADALPAALAANTATGLPTGKSAHSALVVDCGAVVALPSELMLELGVMAGGWVAIGATSLAVAAAATATAGTTAVAGGAGAATTLSNVAYPRYVQAFPSSLPPPSPTTTTTATTKAPHVYVARTALQQVCNVHINLEALARSQTRMASAQLTLSRPSAGCIAPPPTARAITLARVLAPRHDRTVDWSAALGKHMQQRPRLLAVGDIVTVTAARSKARYKVVELNPNLAPTGSSGRNSVAAAVDAMVDAMASPAGMVVDKTSAVYERTAVQSRLPPAIVFPQPSQRAVAEGATTATTTTTRNRTSYYGDDDAGGELDTIAALPLEAKLRTILAACFSPASIRFGLRHPVLLHGQSLKFCGHQHILGLEV
jgi:hypothetical protein